MPHERASVLVLPAAVRDQIVAWATAAYPLETCGVLIGKPLPEPSEPVTTARSGPIAVERALAARNRDRERARDRYDLDPGDFVAADAQARAEGLEIVGIWHSHPDHPAEPSEMDRLAAWEGWSYLIVEVTRAGAGAMRAWRLVERRFVEEPVT